MKLIAFLLCLAGTIVASSPAESLIAFNTAWHLKRGTAEASSPSTAWRQVGYNPTGWLTGNTPIYYGENLAQGTILPDMRNNYTTVFVRKTFQVNNASLVDRLALRVHVDDGFIAWINGYEVARFNVSEGEPTFQSRAQGGIEPTFVTNSLANPSTWLRSGANVLAVQVFNNSLTSSDLVFNAELQATSDRLPPTILSIQPAPGEISELRQATVKFHRTGSRCLRRRSPHQ